MSIVKKVFLWITGRLNRGLVERSHSKLNARLHERTASNNSFDIRHDRRGEILTVKIGDWRLVAACTLRRITSVQEIAGGRLIAIRIDSPQPCSVQPVVTIWETYDRQGHLHSITQSTDDSNIWIETRCHNERQPLSNSLNCEGSSYAIPAWGTADPHT